MCTICCLRSVYNTAKLKPILAVHCLPLCLLQPFLHFVRTASAFTLKWFSGPSNVTDVLPLLIQQRFICFINSNKMKAEKGGGVEKRQPCVQHTTFRCLIVAWCVCVVRMLETGIGYGVYGATICIQHVFCNTWSLWGISCNILCCFNIIFSIALASLVSTSLVSKQMSVVQHSVSICQQQVLPVELTDCCLLGRDAVSLRHLSTFLGHLRGLSGKYPAILNISRTGRVNWM